MAGRKDIGEMSKSVERAQSWTRDKVLWLQILDRNMIKMALRKMKGLVGQKERAIQHRMRVSKRAREAYNFLALSGKTEMMRELYLELYQMRKIGKGKKMNHMMRVSKRNEKWMPKNHMTRTSRRENELRPSEGSLPGETHLILRDQSSRDNPMRAGTRRETTLDQRRRPGTGWSHALIRLSKRMLSNSSHKELLSKRILSNSSHQELPSRIE